MPTPVGAPPLPELDFLRVTGNHREFRDKLSKLGLSAAEAEIAQHTRFIAARWFKLGLAHLREAKRAAKSRQRRTAYSRAYYAAYNASKAVRYVATGFVSLKGDDHQKAGDLPGDFPDPANWASKISSLYEGRLRADYDNWQINKTSFAFGIEQSVLLAAEFVRVAREYLRQTHGVQV